MRRVYLLIAALLVVAALGAWGKAIVGDDGPRIVEKAKSYLPMFPTPIPTPPVQWDLDTVGVVDRMRDGSGNLIFVPTDEIDPHVGEKLLLADYGDLFRGLYGFPFRIHGLRNGELSPYYVICQVSDDADWAWMSPYGPCPGDEKTGPSDLNTDSVWTIMPLIDPNDPEQQAEELGRGTIHRQGHIVHDLFVPSGQIMLIDFHYVIDEAWSNINAENIIDAQVYGLWIDPGHNAGFVCEVWLNNGKKYKADKCAYPVVAINGAD